MARRYAWRTASGVHSPISDKTCFASATPTSSVLPEDLLQLHRRGHLELRIRAVLRRLVGAPALDVGGVAEAAALHVVVGDLDDALDAQRLPGEIFLGVPARGHAGAPLSPGGFVHGLGPTRPRVAREGVVAQRRELLDQGLALLLLEAGGDADVMQHALGVVEAEEQGAQQGALAVLVPAEARHRTVTGAALLHL